MATQSVARFDHLIKLIIVGNSCAGKTQLMHRFAQVTPPIHPVVGVGVDFRIRSVEIGDARCKVQIWDTDGSDFPHRSLSYFCRGVKGIVFAYSITDEESFTRIPHWWAIGMRARFMLACVQAFVVDTVCGSLDFATVGCAFCNC